MIPPTSWYEMVECPNCKDEQEALAHVADAVARADAAPWPNADTLFADVQDVGAPSWR